MSFSCECGRDIPIEVARGILSSNRGRKCSACGLVDTKIRYED